MNVSNFTNQVIEKLPANYQLVYLSLYGSNLYGTALPTSDTDYRGIFIPSMEDLLLGKAEKNIQFSTGDKGTKNTSKDVDINLFSLSYFLELLADGDTGALDLFFSFYRKDTIIYCNNSIIDELKTNRRKLICSTLKPLTGYCLTQAAKYGLKGSRYRELLDFKTACTSMLLSSDKISDCIDKIKQFLTENSLKYISIEIIKDIEYISILGTLTQTNLPMNTLIERLQTKINQYGNRVTTSEVDSKSLMHAFRAVYELQELLSTGHIVFPLEKARELKQIRQTANKDTLPDTITKLETELEYAQTCLQTTTLQESVDKDFIKYFIVRTYLRELEKI